eukprot:m.158850 g.158850  ORF g.158850 m.158850 type:complete len:1318 (+) comp38755_c1_seq1:297-4250(+)
MQEELFYNGLLPYSIEDEAGAHFTEIKNNLSKSILLKELRPGALYWTGELALYLKLYGRRFSKEDHVFLVKLFYELVTIPDLEPLLLEKWATDLTNLLKKTKLLLRNDLSLPWRPLYMTVKEVLYGKGKKESLKSVPKRLEDRVCELVAVARIYFPASSTKEMLNEWRPLLCLFDTSMLEGAFFLASFLPTLLLPEEKSQGYLLWFDELMGLWDVCSHDSTLNQYWSLLFTRLARENVGCIDWMPHLPRIFGQIMKQFGLGKTGNLPKSLPSLISLLKNTQYSGSTETLIVYLLGGGSPTQEYLTCLFQALEPYCHPSKSGLGNLHLSLFLVQLSNKFVDRLHVERKELPSWHQVIPEKAKLTEEDTDAFVNAMKSCVMLSLFNKSTSLNATFALKSLASLRPSLVLPPLLERTYCSLDTLTEPHQLHATLRSLASVSRVLVDGKRFPEGPSHVLPLLNLVLPGIDPNDFIKTISTCTFVSMVVAQMPFVDCSKVPQTREDLTEDEKELCSVTAQFEEFLVNFLNRCFLLIENSGQELSTPSQKTSSMASLFNQENMMENGLFSALQTILCQSSPELFQVALKRLFKFATSHILEVEVAGKMCSSMCRAAAKAYPESTLRLFVPYCAQAVARLTSEAESRDAEHSDPELIWILQLLSELVHCESGVLLLFEEDLKAILTASLHLKCRDASKKAMHALHGILQSLVSTCLTDYQSVPFPLSTPPEEHFYIRDWGKAVHKDSLNLKWHTPSEEELKMVKRLLCDFLLPEINKLKEMISQDGENNQDMLSRDDFQQLLSIVHYGLSGASAVMPHLKGDPVGDIVPSLISSEKQVVGFGGVEIDLDPELSRESLADLFHAVLQHVWKKREDDTKSMTQIAAIMRDLMIHFGANKMEVQLGWQSFHTVKSLMADKLSKTKHIRQLHIERAKLQHEQRILEHKNCRLTQTHLLLMEDLFKLSTSQYTEVRVKCQRALTNAFEAFRHSARVLLPSLLEKLKSADHISHEEFKGTLYVLLSARCNYLCFGQWDTLAKIWPALVQADHSEKPSVLSLMTQLVRNIAVRSNSPAIRQQVPDGCLNAAKVFLDEQISVLDIEEGEKRLKERNEKTLQTYEGLVEKMVGLAESGYLRWKYIEFCNVLLSLLIRYDVPLPTCAVKLFVQNLIHESLNLRKVAISTVGSVLKQQKRKNAVVTLVPESVTTAKWHSSSKDPSIEPGDREDNQWHHYQYESLPKTEEQWKACVFVDKAHWGYYTWPEPFLVYSADKHYSYDQLDKLGPAERVICEAFTSQDFVDKLIEFLSLEDRKGKDKFDQKRFQMFKVSK